MKTYVKITESRFDKSGKSTRAVHGEKSPVHSSVFVGNDEDGWVMVPSVTSIDIPIRQGELRKAVITVINPQVELEGKAY